MAISDTMFIVMALVLLCSSIVSFVVILVENGTRSVQESNRVAILRACTAFGASIILLLALLVVYMLFVMNHCRTEIINIGTQMKTVGNRYQPVVGNRLFDLSAGLYDPTTY